MLDEGAVDGGGVGEVGGGHCHRRPGEEDGVERRARKDPVATDAARRRGVYYRRESGAETRTSGESAGKP